MKLPSLALMLIMLLVRASVGFQESKEPLNLADPDVKKAYDKLSPDAKRTVNRLNEIIKKKDYKPNEELLQLAILTHGKLFRVESLKAYTLEYVTHAHPQIMNALRKSTLSDDKLQLIAINYFMLKEAKYRRDYLQVLGLLYQGGKANPANFTDADRELALALEKLFVQARVSKPFIDVDIAEVDASLMASREKDFEKDVNDIINAKAGSSVLDLGLPSIKRDFDLKDKGTQVDILKLAKLVNTKKYDVKDEFIFQVLGEHGYLFNSSQLNGWLLTYSNSNKEKAYLDKELAATGLTGAKRNVVIISYYKTRQFHDRKYYFDILQRAYTNGTPNFSKLNDDDRAFIKLRNHMFP